MEMQHHLRSGLMRRPVWYLAVIGVGLMLFLTACGSLTPKGQAAQSEKTRLEAAIHHAARIGVPASLLTSIQQQETCISSRLTPVIFGDFNSDGAYTNAITIYRVLEGDVASAVAQATQTASSQAHQDIQSFDALLQQRQNQDCGKSSLKARI